LPETKVFLRVIRMPRIGTDELAEAIKWEIEGNIPLSLDQIYYDYQVIGEELDFLSDEKRQAILVVAVARHVADQYVRVVERAGLEVVGLETESLAQARVFAPKEATPPTTTLIVDLGDRRTSFSVAVANVPLFTSSSHLSAQLLTDVLSKALRVPFAEAEQLKRQRGIGEGSQQNPSTGVLKEALHDLVREIERASNFYNGSLGYTSSIDRILLCGGGSNLIGLIPYLTQRLHQPIEQGDPWRLLRFGQSTVPPIAAGEALQFSTALGLALGSSLSSIYAPAN